MLMIRKALKPGTRISKLPRGALADLEQTFRENRSYTKWKKLNHPVPASARIKREVMRRYAAPDSTWVETGTYHGDTTNSLSKTFPHIYSIEPEYSLFTRACDRFINRKNVTLINSPSETCLGSLLCGLSGPLAFWLDGHASEPGTFHGTEVTPLMKELQYIADNLDRLTEVTIFIDDARLLKGSLGHQEGYPCLTEILGYAKRYGFLYIIEHDIIVLRGR